MSHAPPRRLTARLLDALHGHGRLEDKLVLVGLVGGVLFVTLVATLVIVQQRLGAVQARLVEEAMPAEQQISRLEASIGAAFGRQAQVASTMSSAQLEPLRDAGAVDLPLRAVTAELAQLAAAAALPRHVDEFIAADHAMYAAVERKHQVQARFEVELGKIDGDLRALVEDSQAVAGLLKLEYVLVLRGIAESLAAGAPRRDLVRTAVLGDVRGALDDTAELANAVLALGHVSGKLGLAASNDAITSLAANELPQIRTRIERLIAALDRGGDRRPEVAARVRTLAGRFADIAPRIMDDKRDASLVSLRRQVVLEAGAALKTRADTVAAAAVLTTDARALHAAVAAQVADATRAASVTTTSSRVVSLVIALLGLVGCVFAGRRITGGIDELETTNEHLVELKDNLQSLNANLEDKVAARTQALVTRDRAMQRVLDSMHEGLATLSLDGTLRPERSKAFTAWFGEPGDKPIGSVLFPDDPDRAAIYDWGFAQIAEDALPFEVAVDQVPAELERGDASFALELRPVHEDGKLDAVLLVVRDTTAQRAALRAERTAREDHKVMANLLRDRRGFKRALDELDGLITTARTAVDRTLCARALHTIKGNAAVLGFASLAAIAHELEDELEVEGQVGAAGHARLERGLRDALQRIQDVSLDAHDRLDIDAAEYGRLVDQLRRRTAYEEILALVEAWQHAPVEAILTELAGHARRLAEQSGKQLDVVVECDGLRIVDDDLRGMFRCLVHAVRNAIDHGIEAPEVRRARGKPEAGTLRLAAAVVGDDLVVRVADDGGGVDLERVRAKARAIGLPHDTPAELLDALFSDGLTTRDAVTDLSGRGVGTSAVRAACRELGGDATIVSAWERGAELRCVLPARVVAVTSVERAA